MGKGCLDRFVVLSIEYQQIRHSFYTFSCLPCFAAYKYSKQDEKKGGKGMELFDILPKMFSTLKFDFKVHYPYDSNLYKIQPSQNK